MKFIVHFGSRVYLGDKGTMVLQIADATVYDTFRAANRDGRKYTEPPHCIPMRQRPFYEVLKIC